MVTFSTQAPVLDPAETQAFAQTLCGYHLSLEFDPTNIGRRLEVEGRLQWKRASDPQATPFECDVAGKMEYKPEPDLEVVKAAWVLPRSACLVCTRWAYRRPLHEACGRGVVSCSASTQVHATWNLE